MNSKKSCGSYDNFVEDDTTILMERNSVTGKRNFIYKFNIIDMIETTGSYVRKHEGNLFFAGRKNNPDDPYGDNRHFVIMFNPEKEVRK